ECQCLFVLLTRHPYLEVFRGPGSIEPLNYCFRLWRAPLIDPKNPYLLREGSDYTINYQTGDIQFSTHVVTEGDIITADYDTFEEVAGESLVEAISTGITQAQCSSPVIPESYTIYRAVALRSAPQIKVTGGAYGWQIVFTTPVDVSIDPDNDPETPDIVMTLNRPGKQLTATNKGAVRNPEKAGMYQLWVNTSQEQTPILSEAYEITADKDLGSVKLNIISPQGTASGDTIESVATAGQPISVVTQLMAGSNGLPNVYVKFEIVSTPQPQSAFASPSLVQTNDQGLASVVLNLSATAGTTVVKVYLQDKPSLSWTIRINTGPATSIAKIVVTPSNIALTPNSQQQFTAQAFDTNGTVIPSASFTWAADKGVINPNGLYTAPTDTGIIDKVYARSSGKEGFATVQITQRPQRIEITPQSAIIAAGSKQQYTAQPYDSYGNPMNVTVSWSVKAGTTGAVVGTIDGNGLFTANAGTTGDSVIEACCAGVCGTAKIIISDVSNTVEKVEINPKSLTMTIGGTYQFKAKAYDKNNNEIVNAKFEWAVNPKDNGNISTDGLFMPAKTGTMVVFVIAGGKQDVCLVTVTEPIARIDVTPNSVELEYGSQKTFTATAYTAQGAVIPNITFTWEVSPTSGFAVLSGTTATQATLTAIGSANTAGMLVAKVGNVQGFATVKIIDKKPLDNAGPEITLINPTVSGSCVPTSMQYQLEVKVTDPSNVKEVLVDGVPALLSSNGNYTRNVNIVQGTNTFTIKAKDTIGNETTKQIVVNGSCQRILVITRGSMQGKLTKDCGYPQSIQLKATADNVSGSTVVGLRDLGESLFGGFVDYNASSKTITIKFTRCNGDAYTVECVLNQTVAKISAIDAKGQPLQISNNGIVTLPIAPFIASKNVKKGYYYTQNNGRTMIPMRQLVEAIFGKTMVVNGQTVEVVGYVDALKQATFTVIP
ncbi:MAG: copper amine oxidase N-terminal domain-containing protein, partial [Caldiserica bacterium]|nr:copper amine oxidase N-terminal domain-containing protein [Caldisericota bacterium]